MCEIDCRSRPRQGPTSVPNDDRAAKEEGEAEELEDRRRRRIRNRREGAKVRFEMPAANDASGGGSDSAATRAGEPIGCCHHPPAPSPLTDDERGLCYVTKRETKANKRAAAQLAREHALRHREHVQLLQQLLLQQLFDTPLKCAGGRGGGGKDDNDHNPSDSSDQRRLLLLRELSATDVLGWVDRDPAAGGGVGAGATTTPTTTTPPPTGDVAQMTSASDVLLQRIASSEWARGLEPFVAPLIRRHQRWAIRAVLGRHRQLKAAATAAAATTATRRERGSPGGSGGSGGCSGGCSSPRRQRGRDEYDDEHDGQHDEALRRCCEVVNACTRDMARLLAEADARAAQQIYREDGTRD
jgi:hypothetical protein